MRLCLFRAAEDDLVEKPLSNQFHRASPGLPQFLETMAERGQTDRLVAKKEDESEKQESPEELEESKPKGKKEEKRGRKKRVSEEPEHPNPK